MFFAVVPTECGNTVNKVSVVPRSSVPFTLGPAPYFIVSPRYVTSQGFGPVSSRLTTCGLYNIYIYLFTFVTCGYVGYVIFLSRIEHFEISGKEQYRLSI